MIIAGSVYSYELNKQNQLKARKNFREMGGDGRFAGVRGDFAQAAKEKPPDFFKEPARETGGLPDALEALRPDPVKTRLAIITQRLKSGRRLSGADMSFLREHAPEFYEKALDIEEERRDYERDLKACRSKADVAALKAVKLSGILPSGKGGAETDIETITMRIAAIGDSHERFKRTQRYERLPAKGGGSARDENAED
jgi:hypothetical protein